MQAEAAGDAVFLMESDRRFTFLEADRQVNSIARGLAALGVGQGDRVAFFAHSCAEIVFLILAANRLGAIWVPINTDYKGDWLRDTLISTRAKAVVVDSRLAARLVEVIKSVPECPVLLLGEAPNAPGWMQPFALLQSFSDADIDHAFIRHGDVSAILWTSGTTGKSKGVMQSHNAWIRVALAGSRTYGTRPGDAVLNVLPLYNSAAWSTNILRALVEGIPCALEPGFSVSSFWDRLRFYNATQTFTLGSMHIFLWQAPARKNDTDNPLRVAGMVPMPDDLLRPFCKRFGIEAINQGFGQSEILGFLLREDKPLKTWKPGALGEVGSDMDVRLVDDDGADVAVGQIGEFAVRPREEHAIFEGYFDNEEANAAAFTHDGWYLLGDLGRKDEDGDYFFVDRKKDAVRFKGRNISTLEVEAAIRKHPDVADVAVYGLPSEYLSSESELAAAVVVKPGSGLAAEGLARFVHETAPYFFVPRYIELVSGLPYTPTNKVKKFELRERGVTPSMWDRVTEAFIFERDA